MQSLAYCLTTERRFINQLIGCPAWPSVCKLCCIFEAGPSSFLRLSSRLNTQFRRAAKALLVRPSDFRGSDGEASGQFCAGFSTNLISESEWRWFGRLSHLDHYPRKTQSYLHHCHRRQHFFAACSKTYVSLSVNPLMPGHRFDLVHHASFSKCQKNLICFLLQMIFVAHCAHECEDATFLLLE
jgi:hypothetical protein